ncbi:MAG TPA: NUDIX hydrolase, partial [Arenicellales bacterium]|nr:NUDIX hydrolase [Arenicellales bacterium]
MNPALHVTVAAIAESAGRYLLVEEQIEGRRVINQPAGHWEPGETLYQAVVRETLEETGWDFVPRGLVGIYQWAHPNGRDTFLRFAFHGEAVSNNPTLELDTEIQQVVWRSRQELRSTNVPLRSPQVLRCIDDFERGARFSLDCLNVVGGKARAAAPDGPASPRRDPAHRDHP